MTIYWLLLARSYYFIFIFLRYTNLYLVLKVVRPYRLFDKERHITIVTLEVVVLRRRYDRPVFLLRKIGLIVFFFLIN